MLLTTDEIVVSSDVVVSYGSLEGIKAVVRQIPSLHILISEYLEQANDGYKHQLLLPPVVKDGSSPAAYTKDAIGYYLQKMLYDKAYINQLNQRMQRWQTDGHATERVAEVIKVAAGK